MQRKTEFTNQTFVFFAPFVLFVFTQMVSTLRIFVNLHQGSLHGLLPLSE